MMKETPVLIAGGGPVGMMLAKELSWRGVACMIVERNETTTRHPKMDITNGRTMEHFRRLGMSDAMRAAAVPEDHVFDVSWITDLSGFELARFSYPNVHQARDIIRYVNDGSQPLEPDMRVSQVILEPVLKSFLDEEPLVDVRFGWAFVSFVEDADGVTATLQNTASGEEEKVRCQYLAGCDGGNSKVRKQLGIALGGTPDVAQMYMVHFRSTALDVLQRWGVAWHYQSDKGTMIAQNDKDIWTIHTAIPAGKTAQDMVPEDVVRAFAGTDFEFEVLVANGWAPQLLVAESYGHDRVFLAGDAAHQYVPTGGYGMNTGMGDAVDLGWKLAASLQGWGGAALLGSYDFERRTTGERNLQGSAHHVGIRFQIGMEYGDSLNEPNADEARKRAGENILTLSNIENEALGIEIGTRYSSSIVCAEEGEAPAYDLLTYKPTTWPGARLPSVFLEDGRAVFDLLGKGFTLICFKDLDETIWRDEAVARNLSCDILKLDEPAVRAIYERDYLLIRPDQHVCWRGNEVPTNPGEIWGRVTGNV